MSESSHVPSLLISPTHDGMLGNWRSHDYILHGAEIGFEPMTFWVWARRATNCATLLGCSTRRGRAWPHNPIIDKIIALPGRASVPGRIWTGDPRIKSSLRLPTALQERLTTNAQRIKKYFSFSCAPLSTLHIYYITKFEKCQIFKSKDRKIWTIDFSVLSALRSTIFL